jgi:hypothetical protein
LKRLITADDVGLHPAMTAGALRALTRVVRDVTAVATPPRRQIRRCARRQAGADCGVHLAGRRAVSPPPEVRSLLEATAAPGCAFVWRYVGGGIALAEIEREWRRQIEAVLAAGLRPVHLNSHQHLHALPAGRLDERNMGLDHPVANLLRRHAGVSLESHLDQACLQHGHGLCLLVPGLEQGWVRQLACYATDSSATCNLQKASESGATALGRCHA